MLETFVMQLTKNCSASSQVLRTAEVAGTAVNSEK
jgi:hypothetical protein